MEKPASTGRAVQAIGAESLKYTVPESEEQKKS